MTWQLANRSTVAGTCSPASVKTRIIPTFCAITPERIFVFLPPGAELDLALHAGGEIELHQRVHRLRRRIDDIEQSFMGAHLELLAALLFVLRGSVERELVVPGRSRDRPAHLRAGALGGRHDLACGRIENPMIERFEPDADILAVHCRYLSWLRMANGEWRMENQSIRYSLFRYSPTRRCSPPRRRRPCGRPRGWR